MVLCVNGGTAMKIGTHNGVFHADDVFACAIISTLSKEESEFVRTRDQALLDECDVVVDVGGTHHAPSGRFDHHQKGGAGARPNGVPYSSAGLVWKHYWHDFLGEALYHLDVPVYGSWYTRPLMEKVDRDLIQGIDAADSGFKLFTGGEPVAEGIRAQSVSKVISGFNPTWLEETSFDEAFKLAVFFARNVLLRTVASAVAVLRAESAFLAACEGEGAVVVLDQTVPWAYDIQVPDGKLFVVFPAASGEQWMAQAVPPHPGSFAQRKSLPETWRGLRGSELAELTGVEDAIFCHNGLFICGAVSKEGALALAQLAVAT